jgi:hypothetical protein
MKELDKQCRICLETDSTLGNPLFRPCKCNGTQAFIHEGCLESWRGQNQNERAFAQCPTCKHQYHLARAWYSDILVHPVSIGALTLVCMGLLVFVFVSLIKLMVWLLMDANFAKNTTSELVCFVIQGIGIVTVIVVMFIIAVAGGEIHDLHFGNSSARDESMAYIAAAAGLVIFACFVHAGVKAYVTSTMARVRLRVLSIS